MKVLAVENSRFHQIMISQIFNDAGLDGIKLTQLIQSPKKTKDIPIILLISNEINNSFKHTLQVRKL